MAITVLRITNTSDFCLINASILTCVLPFYSDIFSCDIFSCSEVWLIQLWVSQHYLYYGALRVCMSKCTELRTRCWCQMRQSSIAPRGEQG